MLQTQQINHKINKMQKKYQRTNNKCWLWKMCKIKENYEYGRRKQNFSTNIWAGKIKER